MEERYWELREESERAFDKWFADKQKSNFQAYKEALGIYQDYCTYILEMLIDENPDVLKILQN